LSDAFVQEVDEEYRQDQLKRFFKSYGIWIAAGILLVVVAVVGYTLYQDWQRDEQRAASNRFGEALAYTRIGRVDEGIQILDELANPKGAGIDLLAAFAQAKTLAENGRGAEAVALWQEIADNGQAKPPLANMARYLANLQRLELGEDVAAIPDDLAPLTEPGEALRPLALELSALAQVEAGEIAAARQTLETLSEDPGAPAGVRGRAAQLLQTLAE